MRECITVSARRSLRLLWRRCGSASRGCRQRASGGMLISIPVCGLMHIRMQGGGARGRACRERRGDWRRKRRVLHGARGPRALRRGRAGAVCEHALTLTNAYSGARPPQAFNSVVGDQRFREGRLCQRRACAYVFAYGPAIDICISQYARGAVLEASDALRAAGAACTCVCVCVCLCVCARARACVFGVCV